jgi:hydroxypyruvate isomerase
MLKFAANLSMMYTEYPFLQRFAAAAKDGFTGVEYLFPYEFPQADLVQALQTNGLEQVLFNAPPGHWEAGERGLACLPGRQEEFRSSIAQALQYAQALSCRNVHVMAGIPLHGVTTAEADSVYRANLRDAAGEAEEHGITLMIEPINQRDMPGYFLSTQQQAHDIVKSLDRANVRVQMDLYHCQIAEGDLTSRLRQYLAEKPLRVGHLQIAGVPERYEPDQGEINYPYLFHVIEESSYQGWIGCEYRPAGRTSEGLGWLTRSDGDFNSLKRSS